MAAFREGNFNPAPGRGDAPLPADMAAVLEDFLEHAPEQLPAPESWPAVAANPKVSFTRRAFAPANSLRRPAVSSVRFLDLEDDGLIEIVVSDMRYGMVLSGRPGDGRGELVTAADVPHPSRVARLDLDGDHLDDMVVADLGSLLPGDHDKGGIAWLRQLVNGSYQTFGLTGLPRVADVAAGDFMGDGRQDLVVGAFGWRATGLIALLRNTTADYTRPSFEMLRLDDRHGAIRVIPADLNRDGRTDIVALIAQEHETVIAFINEGAGRFSRHTIFEAPHSNWGFSGMQLVDFDGDGDLDVLVTNGDSFDDFMINPYHGISWLENTGSYPFKEHRLAGLPGVHRAMAVDLDGDGDLDVVASVLLASGTREQLRQMPSLVWLERTGAGTFTRRTLERGMPIHATFDAADYDGDGDIDLVVGNFSPRTPVPAWVEVWENSKE